MRTTITTLLAVASVCVTSVHGQVDNCVELLRLSRTTSRTVVDRSQFTRTVNNFCNEIRSARSENRSLNLDLRVMGLGEGGGSNATTDSLYTKYCSDQSAERRDEFNYQQYLDGIEPGAYAAYERCTTAASNGVQFQMLTSPTRQVLELVVFHQTNDPDARADMSWSASDPVACQWESFRGNGNVEAPRRRVLAANERTRLKCRRDSVNTVPIREPDFVNVIRDGGNATINIPWRKYGPDDNPAPTLEEIRDSMNAAVDAIGASLRDTDQRLQGLIGRRWYNATDIRLDDQCYVNNTDYPLEVAVSTLASDDRLNFCRVDVFVDGELILQQINNISNGALYCAATATVPPGARYHINDDGPGYREGKILMWWELRAGEAGDIRGVECE